MGLINSISDYLQGASTSTSSKTTQNSEIEKPDSDKETNSAATTIFENSCTVLGETSSEKLKKLEDKVKDLTLQMTTKDILISQLNKDLLASKVLLNSRNTDNVNLKEKISKKDKSIEQLSKDLLASKTQLNSRNTDIENLNGKISAKDESNEQLKIELNKSKAQLETKGAEVEELTYYFSALRETRDQLKLQLVRPITSLCIEIFSHNLQELTLIKCSKLINSDFSGFNRFKNLTKLSLYDCSNEGLTEVFVDKLPKNSLKDLTIFGLAKVTDDLVEYLPKNLIYLYLYGSQIDFTNKKMGSFPKTIISLQFSAVKNLNIEGIKKLAENNSDLICLNISGSTNITNEALPLFPKKLDKLYLHNCSIKGISNISELTQISILGLQGWNCDKSDLIDALPPNIDEIVVHHDKEKIAYEEILEKKSRDIKVINSLLT